jgi:hypothetical protein
MPNNVLTLKAEEATNFFMKAEQYHDFELPEYLDFSPILQFVQDNVKDIPYESCIGDLKPDDLSDVNYDILLNKDGKYAVRPLSLVNPYLYYFLVREICNQNSWHLIKECFSKYRVSRIEACALPVIPEKKEPFHQSTTILNWWNSIEQRSLELSLEYRYMFVSDITNCYGSINPQSIDRALCMKDTSNEKLTNHDIATHIITILRAMQQGRNIGIPQGSAIFDFVAEIILGYADLLFHEQLEKEHITDYMILRYRDDYRIFSNNHDELEKISYILQHILESLNFRMNSSKTKLSGSVVTDSIKPDKLFYIFNTPIFNKKGVDFDGIQKYLIYILMFGRKFPNAGQLKTLLSDLDKRIMERLKPHKQLFKLVDRKDLIVKDGKLDGSGKLIKKTIPGRLVENIRAMVAIAIQIALENITVVHYVLRVISRMVDSINDDAEKWDIFDKVYHKLSNQPNSTYIQLWLQNITYQRDKKDNMCLYNSPLCRLVMGENNLSLWNNSWLSDKISESIPYDSIVVKERINDITPVITFRETRKYYESEKYDEETLSDEDAKDYELIITL